jgi:glycosyltransferase involved in cell wall biosynthesis
MRIAMLLDNEINDDLRVSNEINVLTDAGNEVILLCKGKKPNPKFEIREKLKIHRLFLPKKMAGALNILSQKIPFLNYYWFHHLKRLVLKYDIDAIHAHDLYMYWPAYRLSNKLNIPYVLDLHENYPATVKTYGWTKKWYARLFYNPILWAKKEEEILSSADRLVVLSDYYKFDLVKRYPTLKSKSIFRYANVPNLKIFDSFSVDSSLLEKKGAFLLFYFGVIAERRGIYTLLNAVAELSKQYNQIKLLLIGPVDAAEKSKFQKYLETYNLEKHVIHYPWKDISLFPSYVSLSDLCVSPLIRNKQHESGVANKVFQYMYFKRPVLVSDCKPQAEIIEKYHCGDVFESGNVQDLVAKIKQFIENKEKLVKYGENAYRTVNQNYNTEIEGRNLVSLYRSLLVN